MQDFVELHGARTGNCLRAAIALDEAGIPYRAHPVDLWHGEHGSEAYLQINPSGKVPTLVDRKGPTPFVLAQSNAIVLYAADRAPGRLLATAPGKARSLAFERFFFFVTDVITPGFDAAVLRGHGNDAGAQVLETRVADGIYWGERYLADTAFMAGHDFSIADIVAYTFVFSLEKQLDWSRLPRLADWYQTVQKRPAVAKGLHAFDDLSAVARD